MRGLTLLFAFVLLAGLSRAYIIDRFLDDRQSLSVLRGNDSNCRGPPTILEGNTMGNARGLYVQVRNNTSNFQRPGVTTSCPACGPDSQGLLSWSVTTGARADLVVVWDGTPASCTGVNYNGIPAGIDLTDGGVSDSFRIELGDSDLAEVVIVITAYSGGANSASSLSFVPDISSGGNFNLLQLPFATSQIAEGASSAADWSRVTALSLAILSNTTIDLILKLVETAPLLELDKVGVLSTDVNSDQIANPGDSITYTLTLTNARDAFTYDVPGVLIYDDVSLMNGFTSYTLVPGSLTVTRSAGSPTFTILEGDQAGDTRVIVDLGTMPDDTTTTVVFTVQVTDLPCCLPTCTGVMVENLDAGCQIDGQSDVDATRTEDCYCIKNIGYFCSDITTADVDLITAAAGSDWVVDNCVTSTIELVSGAAIPKVIYTPVFATVDPSLTLSLDKNAAVSGDVITVTVNVNNNARRSTSPQRVTVTFPNALAAPLDNGGFSCTAGSCGRDIGSLAANVATQTFTLTFTVLESGSCGSVPFTFAAVVASTGPCTAVEGGNECLDSNLLNNADNDNVTISGEVDLYVTKSAQTPSVAAGGSVVYTIVYGNAGNVPASGVVITENVPAGTTYTGTQGWDCINSTCTLSVASIPAGGEVTTAFTLTFTGPAACGVNSFDNVISIDSDCAESVTNNNQDTESVGITGTPQINLAKSGPTTLAVGAQATYTLTFSNTGARELNNVVLTETIPANTAFDQATNPDWTCTGSSCTYNIGTLPPNSGEASVQFIVTVNSNLDCPIVETSNTANIVGECAGDSFTDDASTTTAITGQPDLTITKTPSTTDPVSPGGSVTYTIDYSNIGVRPAPDVVITETIPDKFTFVAASSSAGWTLDGTVYKINVGTVNAGGSGSVTFTTTLDSTVDCGEPAKTNVVNIETTCTESSTTNNQASVTTPVSGQPDLTVTRITVNPTSAPVCSDVTVTIYYSNIGSSTGTNAVLTVPALSKVTFGNNPTWTVAGGSWTTPLGDIAPGPTEYSVTLNLVLPCTLDCLDDMFPGSAVISNDCGDSNPDNNQNTFQLTVTGNYDLWVTKDDNDAVFKQRTSVTYTINYGNAGVRTVEDVILTETIADETTFAAGSGWTCPSGNTGGSVCTYSIGTLAPGATGTIDVVLTIVDPIPFGFSETTNYVAIGSTSCGTDEVPANNNDEEPTPVVGNPDLVIAKTDNDASLDAGASGTVTYTITYGNQGDADATNVVITERVPSYTTFVAASSTTGWSCPDGSAAGSVCTLNIPTLASGASETATFTVKLYSYVAGQTFAVRCPEVSTLNNVNIMGDANQVELDLTNNAANDTTPVVAAPVLTISKTDNIDDADQSQYKRAGETITYDLSWGNTGTREATQAVVTEVVPQYTTFNPSMSSPGWSCLDGGVAGAICTLNVGSIAPGATGSAVFSVDVGSFPVEVTSTTNNVNITNTCGGSATAVDTTPLIGYFDLLIQKQGRCTSIIWTLTYENIGDITSRMPYIKAHVPSDTIFNAADSNGAWVCQNASAGSECLLSLPALEPTDGGSVVFVADPIPTSKATEFTLFSSIDDDLRGEDLDPTPANNYAQATIGFDGCDTCDSCCPAVDSCCPDQTDVAFNFGGVLDGLKTCSP